MTDFYWSEEAVRDLRKWHAAGHSDSQMARDLSDKYGGRVSRNSVIGKRHRIGAFDHTRAIRPKSGIHRRRMEVPAIKREVKARAHIVRKIEERITLNAGINNNFSLDVPGYRCEAVSLDNLAPDSCRWPVDAGGFCGVVAERNLSYCAVHCRVAYRSVEQVRAASRKLARNTVPY